MVGRVALPLDIRISVGLRRSILRGEYEQNEMEIVRRTLRSDDKVLECAVVGGATHIVMGDRRHLLSLGSYQGIPIVSAADFLALVSVP